MASTEINQHIFDETITLNLQLARLDAGTASEVLNELREMQKHLLLLLSDDDVSTWGKRRLNQQLAEANRVIAEYYGTSETLTYTATQGIAPIVASSTSGAISVSLGGQVPGILPTTTYMETIAKGAIIQGHVQSDWWSKQSADMAFRFEGAVKQGLINAETNSQIITRVRDAISISQRNATTLVRTSVMGVANQTREEVYRRNSDVLSALEFNSAIDSRVCAQCAPRDGLRWSIETYKPIGHSIPYQTPPIHVNCLPADSLVTPSSNITGASKRWMDGEMVIIKTSSGNVLSCTPSHPVLTNIGWVKAKFLDVGDNVVANVIGDRPIISGRNNKNIPTAIHKITESFFSSRKVSPTPVPMSPKDFHGDGADSKVGIVWSDSFLSSESNTLCRKHRCKRIFMDRWASAKSFFHCDGSFNFSFKTMFSSSNSIMSCLRQCKSFFSSCISHSCELLFRLIPKLYPLLIESSCDNFSGTTYSFGDTTNSNTRIKEPDSFRHINIDDFSLSDDSFSVESFDDSRITDVSAIADVLERNSALIFFDDIIDVSVVEFHGYVYNIETENGWYTANGIITHNCRCVTLPVTKTFRDLGIDIDEVDMSARASMEGVITDKTFGDYMERKGKTFTESILGVGRAELYRNGTINLEQLIDGRGRLLSLKQLQEKYIK